MESTQTTNGEREEGGKEATRGIFGSSCEGLAEFRWKGGVGWARNGMDKVGGGFDEERNQSLA